MLALDRTLLPDERELRVLRAHVSSDPYAHAVNVLWQYVSDGGASYVATDGRAIILRRSGAHCGLPLDHISRLTPIAVNAIANQRPPKWPRVLVPPGGGPLAECYGIDPAYIARVGDVERAASRRACAAIGCMRATGHLFGDAPHAVSHWKLPSDPLAGWYWRLETNEALWEGTIMPRRVGGRA